MFQCPRWDCLLEEVTEWQQMDCEKNGLDCYGCMEQADFDDAEEVR